MGIYIAEEAPKGCLGCKLHNPMGVYDQCFWTKSVIDEFTYYGDPQNPTRPDDCPLLAVAPHGLLIDADALVEDLKYDVEMDAVALDSMEIVGDERRKIQDDKDFKQNCIFWIENAPTIIPAEEGET